MQNAADPELRARLTYTGTITLSAADSATSGNPAPKDIPHRRVGRPDARERAEEKRRRRAAKRRELART